MEQTCKDSWDLFIDLQRHNRYTAAMLSQFSTSLATIRKDIEDGRKTERSSALLRRGSYSYFLVQFRAGGHHAVNQSVFGCLLRIEPEITIGIFLYLGDSLFGTPWRQSD